jgi:hypothetical protein
VRLRLCQLAPVVWTAGSCTDCLSPFGREVLLTERSDTKSPRRVGPQRAVDFGLRAEVDWTGARKSATPRSADIRESVGYSGM